MQPAISKLTWKVHLILHGHRCVGCPSVQSLSTSTKVAQQIKAYIALQGDIQLLRELVGCISHYLLQQQPAMLQDTPDMFCRNQRTKQQARRLLAFHSTLERLRLSRLPLKAFRHRWQRTGRQQPSKASRQAISAALYKGPMQWLCGDADCFQVHAVRASLRACSCTIQP